MAGTTLKRISVVDTHTAGEPTRVVVAGGPDLGDGPLAGLAAACLAAETGKRVALLDNAPWLGGQIWRGEEAHPTHTIARHWIQRLRQSGTQILPQATAFAAPYYSLPRLEELFVHFKAVNDAIGIPIMLYNYPGRTGVDMPPEFIERLAALERLRYVKESTGEMPRITELLRRCGDRLGVFCGCDTIALESLIVGGLAVSVIEC